MHDVSTPVEDRTVLAALTKSTKRYETKLAVEDGTEQVTYGELFGDAQRIGAGFASLGVQSGDSVLLLLDNHVDYVRSWIGLCFVAGVEVPVNTAYKGEVLTHIVNDSGARFIVAEGRYCDRIARVADRLLHLETIIVRGTPNAEPPSKLRYVPFDMLGDTRPMSPRPTRPGDVMGLMYTSGTTGPSRGVVVPYGHAWSAGAPEFFGYATSDDRTLVTLPLFHVVGQWAGVYNALIAGATAIVRPRFSATNFWEEARDFDCTYTLLLGAMARFLYRQPRGHDDAENPIEHVLMFPIVSEIEDFRQRFGVEVLTAYGMTEVSSPIVAPSGRVTPGGCGWVRADFDLRIVDDQDLAVRTGETGELLLRPRNPWSVMLGYHNDPEKTLRFFRNLWLHTGDLVRQGDDGQVYFVDRRSDALRRRGENISSFDVESAINRHPRIQESAVVGVPSEDTEDEILAAIVLREGVGSIDLPELIRFLSKELPYFMVPRFVKVVDELPKTPTQKLRKHVIRERGIQGAWDCEAAGLRVERAGLIEPDG